MYSFQVYPSTILGTTNFQKVTVKSILDYNSAMQFADIVAQHENVFPHLPEGTPDRPQDFDYLLLETAAGRTIIGVPWIILDSVEEVGSMKIQVVVEDVSTNDVERVRACLTQNGYHKIDLKIVP